MHKTSSILFFAIVFFIGVHSILLASTIHQAAAKGDVVLVKTLVMNEPSLAWELDERGVTPLHMASFYGKLEVVEFLLSAGAPVDPVTKNGYTPLLWAVWQKQLPVVVELLEHDADINAKSAVGMVSLHFAVQNEDVEMVKYLLAHGANKTAKDSLGLTPVEMAKASKSKTMVSVFPELSAKPVNVVVKPTAKEKPESTVVISKVESKTKEQLILNRSIILAIFEASDMQKLQALESILQRNPNMLKAVDSNGASMLHWLAQADWADGIELLVDRGANINLGKKDGVTPLQVAAALGKVDALKKLLDLRADPYIQDKQGRTALSLAVERGQEQAEQILVSMD